VVGKRRRSYSSSSAICNSSSEDEEEAPVGRRLTKAAAKRETPPLNLKSVPEVQLEYIHKQMGSDPLRPTQRRRKNSNGSATRLRPAPYYTRNRGKTY
jgi:hypothetical protein